MPKVVSLRTEDTAQRVSRKLPHYRDSLGGRLQAAREALAAPFRGMLRKAGITEQQYRVLQVLFDDGEIDLSTLATNSLLRPPSISRILQDLEARDLVRRRNDPGDGRRSIVAISPSGREVVEGIVSPTLDLMDRYAAMFGLDRLNQLSEELALLAQTLAPGGLASLGEDGD